MIRPEEIRVKKSREYFKRLATIDERAKKKKKKENSTRSINEEKKVTSVLRSTWDPRPRDVIALIRIIKNAANYDAARTFSATLDSILPDINAKFLTDQFLLSGSFFFSLRRY